MSWENSTSKCMPWRNLKWRWGPVGRQRHLWAAAIWGNWLFTFLLRKTNFPHQQQTLPEWRLHSVRAWWVNICGVLPGPLHSLCGQGPICLSPQPQRAHSPCKCPCLDPSQEDVKTCQNPVILNNGLRVNIEQLFYIKRNKTNMRSIQTVLSLVPQPPVQLWVNYISLPF